MYIVGINYSTNSNGQKVSTIYVTEPFEPYYTNVEAGRSCIGEKTESIYVGDYDCSNLEIGMEIEIFYDKAISTKKGTYQPIKKIDII